MTQLDLPPHGIALAANPQIPDALVVAREMDSFLRDAGVKRRTIGLIGEEALTRELASGTFDLLIALGGDGTVLRAGHLCAPLHIPLMGVNMGRFGFLTQCRRDEWQSVFPKLLTGEYQIENRMMLRADHWRLDRQLSSWLVINDAVVCRGDIVRPVRLKARVDGYSVASYVADGLIASTPTGSTAYALAVGGPIMPPELRNILIVPVAPHLSMDRAVILPEGASVTIAVETDHYAVLSVDGQTPVPLESGDEVRITADENSVEFVRLHDPGHFYRTLANYMEQNPSITGES